MSGDLYHSPWRNSIVMAPSGRNLSQGNVPSKHLPVSMPRVSTISAESLPLDRECMDGLLDNLLQIIDIPVDEQDEDDVKITKCTYLGSYSWVRVDGGTPTILVPGSPPQWQNRQVPYTIPPNRGIHFCDQDGYKMPRAVLLPLVVAVNKWSEMNNEAPFDWSSVDIVTDKINLLKLVRWVEGKGHDFRIDLQLAGEGTVLMARWSERHRELFNGRTYDNSFEKESTIPASGCKNATGHHRIVTYDLNGLKMVVRFQVNACIRPPAKYPRRSMSSIDELTQSMSAAATISQTTFRSEHPLIIREGGSEVSATTIIELTTRSQALIESKGFNLREEYPRLFFSQTANHYLAIHKHGRFFNIEKRKLTSEELQAVGQEAQGELKKVKRVLEVIRNAVLVHGKQGRLSLVCKDGALGVYQRSSEESLLPSVVMKLFETS